MNLSKPGVSNGDAQPNELLNLSSASVLSGKTPRFVLSKEPSKMDSMQHKPVLSLNPSPSSSPLLKLPIKDVKNSTAALGSKRILAFDGDQTRNNHLLAVPTVEYWIQNEVADEGSLKSSPKTSSAHGPRIEGIKAPRASSPHQDFSPPDTPTSRSIFVAPQAIPVNTEHSFFDPKDPRQIPTGVANTGAEPFVPKLDLFHANRVRHNHIISGDASVEVTDRYNVPPFSERSPEKTTVSGIDLKNLLECDSRGVLSPGFKFDQTSKMLVSSNVIDMQPDVHLFLKTQRTLESMTKRDHEPPVSIKGNMSTSQIRSSQIRGSTRKLEESRISNYRNGIFSSRISHDGGQTSSRKVLYGKKNSNLIEPETWSIKPALFNWHNHLKLVQKAPDEPVNNNRTIQEQESELLEEYKIAVESPVLLTEVLNNPNSVNNLNDRSINSNLTAKMRSKLSKCGASCPKLTPIQQNFPIQELFAPVIPAASPQQTGTKSAKKTPGPRFASRDQLHPASRRPEQPRLPTVSWLSVLRGEYRPKGFFELGEREHPDVVFAERLLVAEIAAALTGSRRFLQA